MRPVPPPPPSLSFPSPLHPLPFQANALQKVMKKKEVVEKYQKDMEAMIALDTHEDEIRLCAAKLLWSDVAEAEAVVKELQTKNTKLERDLQQAERDLALVMKKKDAFGDSAALSNVSPVPCTARPWSDCPSPALRSWKRFIKRK
jgi:hypothetical protein